MNVCWIRRDLRLHDHAALSMATQCGPTCVIFILDTNILDKITDRRTNRITFIQKSLIEIDETLKKRNTRLVVLRGDPEQELKKFCLKHKVHQLYFNFDPDPYALKRDKSVYETLSAQKISVHRLKDHVIFSGQEILKDNGEPYRVFTPYKNAWLKRFMRKMTKPHCVELKNLTSPEQNFTTLDDLNFNSMGFEPGDISPFKAGTKSALQILNNFEIRSYQKNRDFPSAQGTSRLSPHLRFGNISIREAVEKSLSGNSTGHQTWLNELIWRDFYQMILFHYPHVEHESFNPLYKNLKWPGREEHFEAWKAGLTGYPIVDAGMRELLQTGYMHNRVRMIVASFLTKDLLVSWQKGEAWFKEKLLDYELASNNGGWQWAASTGCDAQPYFRIFNPVLQSQKFDASGEYIKQFVPELRKVTIKHIHNPWTMTPELQSTAGVIIGKDYPNPIVDHASQKDKVLRLFKKL